MVMDAISIVLSIFILMGLGMLLVALKWISKNGMILISQLTTKIALPAIIVKNLFENYTRDSLLQNMVGILVPLLSISVAMALGALLAKLIRIPKHRVGVFTSLFAFSNSVFIGVPVAQALFGDEVLTYTLLYYIGNTALFWSISYSMMCADAEGKFEWRNLKSHLGKLVSPPLISFALCFVLVLLGVRMPSFVMKAAGFAGNLVTPLSLFFTGATLGAMIRDRKLRWEWSYLAIIAGRALVAPVLLWLTTLLIPVPPIMRKALITQASMPCMAQSAIAAASAGADSEYAAGATAVTTAFTLVSLPALIFLFDMGIL